MRSIVAPVAVALASIAVAKAQSSYQLVDEFSGPNFFDNFDFFSDRDPTNGYVSYQDRAAALSPVNGNQTLIGYFPDRGTAYMGVDFTNVAEAPGRKSVRITSKKSYNEGLFIADIQHMPVNVCGAWPALWLLGDPATELWPGAGEIDIVEGVNDQLTNTMSLHTSPGCMVASSGAGSLAVSAGTANTAPNPRAGTDCNALTGDSACTIVLPGSPQARKPPMGQLSGAAPALPPSFGESFNNASGGIYAALWNADGITIWLFPRDQVPSDIAAGAPAPPIGPALGVSRRGSTGTTGTTAADEWGTPLARFTGTNCAFTARFRDLQVVLNTAFCGDWAGKVWDEPQRLGGPSCAQRTGVPTCEAYVRDNPAVFQKAFWEIASLKWYQQPGYVGVAAPPTGGDPEQGAIDDATHGVITTRDGDSSLVDPDLRQRLHTSGAVVSSSPGLMVVLLTTVILLVLPF